MKSPIKRKTLFCIVLFTGIQFLRATSSSDNTDNFHVFLLLGQSNMEGKRSVDGQMDKVQHPRIFKLSKKQKWIPATDPITNHSAFAVGPGMSFAKTLVEEDPEVRIGLINLAKGGSSIAQWKKGTKLYNDALSCAIKAKESGLLKGVLWHQGEHDMWDDPNEPNRVEKYQENLEQLIDDFRKDLLDPYLPWIVAGYTDVIESHEPGFEQVFEQLKTVGTHFFRTGYVSSKGIPYLPWEPIHFTTEGQQELGKRFAAEYLKMNSFDPDELKSKMGHWTLKGKDWLDSEALVDDTGWKYHPELGVYWDDKFPTIKHAQLGWLNVEMDKNFHIFLDSPFIGKDPETKGKTNRSEGIYRIEKNDPYENAFYIFEQDLSDPQVPVFSNPIWVNLLAVEGSEFAFFDQNEGVFRPNLPNMPVLETVEDYSLLINALKQKMEDTKQKLVEGALSGAKWSELRQYIDEIQYFRNYANIYTHEAYHFADENERPELRESSMVQFIEILQELDEFVGESQTLYNEATQKLLNGWFAGE